MALPRLLDFRRSPSLRPAVLAAALLVPSSALAAIQWHPDLATARAAARITQRPVLAVFTASWSAASNALETKSLASPEAEAVLAACFEPVRIDIDAHADLTRRLGIRHVPTACLLGDDDTPRATFEIPDTPPAFVAAAVRAAQDAAAADGMTMPEDPTTWPPSGSATAAALATAGIGASPGTDAARPTSKLKSKVQQLSAFASGARATLQLASPPHVVAKSATEAAEPIAAAAAATVDEQAASGSTQRVGWPAEIAAAPPTASALPPRPTLEPLSVATTAAGNNAPWLEARPAAAGDAPPAAPDASPPAPTPFTPPTPSQALAAATPVPAAPAAVPAPAAEPAPGGPAAAPAEKRNPFVAAFQNPFGLWGDTKRPATAPALPPPPTMPPARSQSGPTLGGLAAAAGRPAVEPPAADAHGSMPLGLEGYCPVTLAEQGRWVEGRAQWGARHRGRTYLFAGADKQQSFLANPDRYAPALSGDDPVLAFESGRSTPGQRRYGVTYQSRVYLFATPESRTRFAADPGRYTARVAVAEQPAGVVRR